MISTMERPVAVFNSSVKLFPALSTATIAIVMSMPGIIGLPSDSLSSYTGLGFNFASTMRAGWFGPELPTPTPV